MLLTFYVDYGTIVLEKQMNTKDTNYKDVLARSGLNDSEAVVYEVLIKNGQTGILPLQKLIPSLSRTNLYNVLNSLTDKGLVSKTDAKKKLEYRPNDPFQLKVYLNDQERELSQAQKMIDSVIPGLSELYKNTTEKPVVRFYEGRPGIKAVMDDSLTANTEILEYIDPKDVDKYINDANKNYVKNRIKLRIHKKLLVPDNSFNRDRYKSSNDVLTEIRYLGYDFPAFDTVMQIYGNKISYMIIRPTTAVGIIIEDKFIATMHQALFEHNWASASK